MKTISPQVIALAILLSAANVFAQPLPPGGVLCTNCPPDTNYYVAPPYVPGLKLSTSLNGTNLYLNLLEADPAGTYGIFAASNLVSAPWNDVLSGTNGQTNFTLPYSFADMGFFRAARTDTPVTDTAGMTVQFPNNDVNTGLISADISGGPAAAMAVLVNDTNLADAVWIPFSAVPYVLLGTNDGTYQVEFGFIGSDGQTNWTSASVTLDTTPPALIITGPTNGTVDEPMIQLQGHSPEALSGISYDLTNALGLVTNQQVLVLDQFYDTNIFKFTTNTFQGFDIPLTNGLNTITLHATDLAGNVTVTNFSFTLDYSGKTNPPAVQITWPQNGAEVCGSNFTCNGSVGDPTATIIVQMVDTNNDTNVVNAAVGRDGSFSAEDLPLNGGTNYLTLTATDAAGNVTTTNLTVVQGDVGLNIDSVSAGQTIVTGEIGSGGYTVWVNGAQATNNGDGTWTAQIAPIGVGGGAVEAMAVPNSDNGGNGSGGSDSSGNPNSTQGQGVQARVDAPEGVYISSYQEYDQETQWEIFNNVYYSNTDTNFTHWTDGKGGNGLQTIDDGQGIIIWRNYTWPPTSWPQPLPDGTDMYETGSWLPDPNNPTYRYGTNAGTPPALAMEQGVINVAWTDSSDQSGDTSTRTAATKLNLATGGRAGSTTMNLWVISATAATYVQTWGWQQTGTAVNSTNISIMGKALGSDGNLYVVLPDNTNLDATPVIAGSPSYYTFSVTATKYKSYFEVFVDQPDPTGAHVWTLADAAGHAWWRLRTDAPSDAINAKIPTNLIPFIGVSVGYANTNNTAVTLYSPNAPGELRDPESDVFFSVYRKYDIGFPNLIGGLTYTKDIHDGPGTYMIYSFNCVDAVISDGASSGIRLPNNKGIWPFSNPENFGKGLPPSD